MQRLCVLYLLRGPLTDLRQTWWMYVGGPRNCPWGVLFLKGQRVDRSTGHFHFHYIIYAPGSRHTAAKSARRMIADDTRLTPHHCKKHTVSFARSKGIYPSVVQCKQFFFHFQFLYLAHNVPQWNTLYVLSSCKHTIQYIKYSFYNISLI